MIDYYIISNTSRAANYGIGTYCRQIVSCVEESNDICISHIEMFANTLEFLKEVDEKGNIHYKIPIVSGNAEDEIGCKNAFYYLSQHIKPKKGTTQIFHFNYFRHYHLAVMLKEAYSGCRIILTVHYLNWCFELMGNASLFRHYISTSSTLEDNESNRVGKTVLGNFELERNFMSLADDVIVMSKATQNIIINDYKISSSKITLIYNGYDVNNYICKKSSDIKSFSKSDCKYILFVGRLDKIKGVPYLIKAFNKLSSEDKNLHLIIVGDGDFSTCMAASKGNWDKITFTGKISMDELEHIYSKTTLGVLPSFHEQCSYAVIEMMAHGIPLVVTDSTGLKEMIEESPSCIVSINHDNFSEEEFVDTLYHTIYKLISNDTVLQETSLLVQRLHQRRYTLSAMGKAYRTLFNSVNRPIFSKDLLYMIDRRMISLIDSCPDIDTSFFGMTGIGCYLWYRISTLKDSDDKQDISHCLLLQEYMIYWMDWIYETIQLGEQQFPIELSFLTKELNNNGFYTSQAIKLANVTASEVQKENTEEAILANALKIFRCNI